MFSETIKDYLEQHHVHARWLSHRRAVSAPRLAQSLHVSGRRVAKPVILRADEGYYMALVPSNAEVDMDRMARLIGAEKVRLADENEFARLFPDCELGSEPPFGHLYNVPVVMDESLQDSNTIVFRVGSHEDACEMDVDDYLELEHPRVAPIAFARGRAPSETSFTESQQG